MINKDIDNLLDGSIDMHLHCGPDEMRYRVDALEAAEQAAEAGMRAIVLKNHSFPTTPLASTIGPLVPDIQVFGSVCLDYEIGGLNLDALEKHARLGARVVWMPTFSSTNSRDKMRELGLALEGEGFSILNAGGKLVPEIAGILSIIKEYDMVLANGHISPAETFALVEAARKAGIEKIVITHPADYQFLDKVLSLEEQRQLAEMGAYIEQTFVTLLPTEFSDDPMERVKSIRTIGAEHCIMSTDLGQYWNPPPAEGMRFFISTMLRKGISYDEIELMVKKNPAGLLGLD